MVSQAMRSEVRHPTPTLLLKEDSRNRDFCFPHYIGRELEELAIVIGASLNGKCRVLSG